MSSEYDYYKHACTVYVPIVLKVPVYVEPEVIAKPAECKNGYNSVPYSQPVPAAS
jgi:hypothetical protein